MSPLPSYLNAFCVLQEAKADRLQCLPRPLVEPVDGCAVHNGWKLPAADPQLVPHRGETESHLRSHKGGENQEGIRSSHREIAMALGSLFPGKLGNTSNGVKKKKNLSIPPRLLTKKLRKLGLHEARGRLLPLNQMRREALQNCSG